ncbi:MAG: VWA domain-containing protein [Pseudomonadota bacterium]
MNFNMAFLQWYWLLLLPFPWLWFSWRFACSSNWPQIMPRINMFYPLLGDLTQLDNNSLKKNKQGLSANKIISIAFTFMIIALAQPVSYRSYKPVQNASEPVDMILVVDTALSMSLEDYEIKGQAISRLKMSQWLLNDFIQNYSGSRMGLVLLATPPALWLPLTSDKAVVQNAVSRITTLLGGRISDMGATLKLIQQQFQLEPQKNNSLASNSKQEKVVVLISDGSTQLGSISPVDAAKQLADQGFSLYIIAIGSAHFEAGYNANSRLLYEPTNIKMLQQVADTGHGQLFHALDAQAFNHALATIEAKHRKLIVSKDPIKLSQPWYQLPLFIAMILFLYAVLFANKESREPKPL